MAAYETIEELMNTTEGMSYIRNNSKNDSSTDTIRNTAVDWFKFNGSNITGIYVNGDSQVSFNSTSGKNLNVCNRDGASYYVLYQEGTIKNLSFIKIRWSGYTNWNSSTSAYSLKYELFLFSDNRMFLNVIQTPTNSSYLGTSTFVCGSNTYPLTIGVNSTCPIYYVFEPSDADCKAWSVTSGSIIDFSIKRYLLRSNENLYLTDGTLLEGHELSGETFTTYGASDLNGLNMDFMNENDVEILWWSESSSKEPPSLTATVDQDNVTLRTSFDLSNETYIGIQKIRFISIGNFGIRYSPDNATWSEYYSDEDFMELDFEKIWQECSDTKMLYIEVVLKDDTSDLTSILLYPIINR